MIRSMSGYGRGLAEGDGVLISVEVRTVNHRFCRIGLHMPAEMAFFEGSARKLISDRVERGKVDVTATVRGQRAMPAVQLDEELAGAYKTALVELAGRLDVTPEIDLAMLTGLPGVVTTQAALQLEPDRDQDVAERALEAALDELDQMRVAEGAHLAADMADRLRIVETMIDGIRGKTGDLPRRYRDLISARIGALLDDSGEVDAARLAQEVAYYADRSDITEEIVRLGSHLTKAADLLERGGAVGRSLEFLLQEMHREINTIGAKAKVVEIGDAVVDLKGELERIREQVQNVE